MAARRENELPAPIEELWRLGLPKGVLSIAAWTPNRFRQRCGHRWSAHSAELERRELMGSLQLASKLELPRRRIDFGTRAPR